jgi:XRE family transcriptional regulator, regulator of sulfur utilization
MAKPNSSRGRRPSARAQSTRPPKGSRRHPPRTVIARAFGTALRDLRIDRGLTQDALAEAAGLDRTYPSLLERGLRAPTFLVMWRLSRALGVPLAELTDRMQNEIAKPSNP